jgi:hypothetical protein
VFERDTEGTRRDWIALICVGCIALGWFAMDTLEVRVGRFSHGTRFYELLAVLRHPAALLFGVDDSYRFEVLVFTLLCLAALAAVLAPQLAPAPAPAARRPGALAGLLPLALMVLIGTELYRGGVRLDVDAAPDALRADLLQLAQDVLQRAQDQFAHHVAAGWGAYLSMSASLVLAVRSLARLRAPLAALPASEYPPG